MSESISLSIPRTREYVPPVSSESTSSGTNIVEVDSSTPVLLISNYTYGGSNVTAGQTFKLRMTFFNASKDFDIENIKITLSSAENAFTPVSSSNTFYISGIAANSSVTKEIELLADATLTPKSYGIAVSYDYESVYDQKHNKNTCDETITIPVTQLDRFELGDLDYAPDGYVGMESYLSLNYTNKGKGTVYKPFGPRGRRRL